MEATVVSVQPNVTKQGNGGPYQVHMFTYQPDSSPQYGAKPPPTRPIFVVDRNYPDLPNKVVALQPGQRVLLNFVQGANPRFKDLTDVQVIGAAGAPQQPPQQYQPQEQPQQYTQAAPAVAPQACSKEKYWQDKALRDAENDVRIVRECAIKAGVELVKGFIAKEGYYTKKVKPDVVAVDVLLLADIFEEYIHRQKDFNPEQGFEEEPPLPDPPFDQEPGPGQGY